MYGAIIGDLAGSIYEFEQTKQTRPIYINKIIEETSFYSDDTILTIAILDAILNNKDYEKYLKLYAQKYSKYKPQFSPYFKSAFSPGFTNWVNGKNEGKSIGNGAIMRISPVGYMFETEKDVIKNAKLATTPSHNSKEAIESATNVALIIFYLRKQLTKEEIYEKLNIKPQYQPFKVFNTTCKETIDNCLYALYNSNNFTEAIKNTVAMGGDTDTNAAIVGSMAEALYGIPNELITKAKEKIPEDFVETLDQGYSKII